MFNFPMMSQNKLQAPLLVVPFRHSSVRPVIILPLEPNNFDL